MTMKRITATLHVTPGHALKLKREMIGAQLRLKDDEAAPWFRVESITLLSIIRGYGLCVMEMRGVEL